MTPQSRDRTKFPDPVYTSTVLKPLFDGAKRHHAQALQKVDRAHLVMLVETGIVPAEQGGRIAAALEAIAREINPETLSYTGEVEDFFFLMEKELKTRVGPDLGGRLHTARSRNDIDHTLFKLGLKERIDALLAKSRALLTALIETAERDKATLIVAYTHGQPAQPSTYGHYLGAVIEILIRDIERIEAARTIVDRSSMGAAAITTSGFPIDRHRVAHLLGFDSPLQNSYSCIAAVDYVTSTYGALELMFLHLGRPIQDFQFWSSFEVGQLYLPNAFVQISSIMPQKRNPVPFEHLRHLASQTVGRARAMLDVMHNTPFTDMNDSEGETQDMGYQAFDVAERVLDLLAAVVRAAEIDPRRVAVNLRRSCVTITELADTLVRREGLSFRQAHEIAAVVARSVVAMDGDLSDDGYAPFVAAFEEATGRAPELDAEAFATVVSAENFVAVRERFGGPGKKALEAAIAGYRRDQVAFAAQAEERARLEAAAAKELDQKIAELAGGA
ncbi:MULTISPECIES: argininosuccinate lyase [unclassified Shinella]|uniref:argininosuccinate lyase n=1 Tax=unclassified Shinella TaxID=2643062 RepID=UPI00225CF36B|nr:argininosuccinate lyase [Shinella sp. YE25]MDC7260189.1 argininosuccinate lyase [Shinella sp. YE25]CAI0341050.1 Argininosuccinate lyase 2 [Rhizobiaceae bacterium]CAK7262093.1 Argininosuccinate lyase 2 [Shinella sp. WSC3-e]